MPTAPIPENEAARLAALDSLRILDSTTEPAFDQIVLTARRLMHAPISLISFVAADRQWFKAVSGIEATETDRDVAFCSWAILQDEPLVVEDATKDPRFFDNPLVVVEPRIRFYAGAQLITEDGYRLGTVNVMDFEPRTATNDEVKMLVLLARHVIRMTEIQKASLEVLERYSQAASLEAELAIASEVEFGPAVLAA